MGAISLKNKSVQQVIEEIAEVAGYLWERGWAERNAGNISVNITEFVNKEMTAAFKGLPIQTLTVSVRRPRASGLRLQGNVFLLTGTGTRMRDVATRPEEHLCFVRIDNNGTGYQQFCLCPGNKDLQPTSELPTHLLIQEMLSGKGAEQKVVLHTHATELIALTQIREFTSEKAINRLLWSMHPETIIFVPQGAGFIPYTLPGTNKIALATRKELETHRAVIWEKHGVFATGTTVAGAFDTIDLLAKSAGIFFHCRNAGFDPEGLTNDQLKIIRKNYQL